MPDYEITNDLTGEKLIVSGDVPPTQQDAQEIFAQRAAQQPVVQPRAPSSIQPLADEQGLLGKVMNPAMELAAGFNRPFAWLADKTVMTPINLVRQIQGKPFILLEDMVGQKGQFNGEGLITDVAAAAGELSGSFLGGGTVTRLVSGLIDDAARMGPSTLRRVVKELGRASPSDDIAMGLASGAGGEFTAEAVEKYLGEEYESAGRTAGQLASPVAWSITMQSLLNVGKNIMASAPKAQELKGAGRALFMKLDEAKLYSPDGGAGVAQSVARTVSEEQIVPELFPKMSMISNNLMRRAKKGKLTFNYLDKVHSLLKRHASQNQDVESYVAGKLADTVDDAIFSLVPLNPDALGGISQQQAIIAARTYWRRGAVVDKLDRIFKNTKTEVLGNKADFQQTLRSKLTELMKDKKFANTLTDHDRGAIIDLMKGGGIRQTLEAVAKLGMNSDDYSRSIFYAGLGGLGAAITKTEINPAIPAALAAGLTVTKASSMLANQAFKRNAAMMRAVIQAGPNAEKVARAYIASTPKNLRSPQELSALLLSVNANLPSISQAPMSKMPLVADAVYLATWAQAEMLKEKAKETPK